MTDLGRLSTQHQQAYSTASAIDRAVRELKATPVGQVQDDSGDLGRYLASVAGLIDPAMADEIDPELASAVPRVLVASFADRSRSDPELSLRLLATARELKSGHRLAPDQIELVEDVADVATRDALQLTREILAS